MKKGLKKLTAMLIASSVAIAACPVFANAAGGSSSGGGGSSSSSSGSSVGGTTWYPSADTVKKLSSAPEVSAVCTVDENGNAVFRADSVTLDNADNNDTVYLASYNVDDELVGVSMKKYSEDTPLEVSASGVSSFKLFVWDGSNKPKSAPYESSMKIVPAGAFDKDNAVYKHYDVSDDYFYDTAAAKAAAALADYKPFMCYDTADKTSIVTNYMLEDGTESESKAKLFVNGVEVEWNKDNLYEYLTSNNIGTITLTDKNSNGSYDTVNVEYFKSAVVSDVMEDGMVYFDTMEEDLESSMEFKEGTSYSITSGGEKINYTDLKEGDVISIAYDVTKNFEDSSFYTVLVSRDKPEGLITKQDYENSTYTVNGKDYKYDYSLPDGTMRDAVGSVAVLYTDVFGRIVKIDESVLNRKYAIIENVYQKAGERDYTVTLVLPDASTAEYTARNQETETNCISILGNDFINPVYDRVVEYKTNSSNEIYDVKLVSGSNKKYSKDTYSARSNKIGLVKLNENTTLLDASEYRSSYYDYKRAVSLNDGLDYDVYAYGRLPDNTFSFVIIIDGQANIAEETITEENGIGIVENVFCKAGDIEFTARIVSPDKTACEYRVKTDEDKSMLTEMMQKPFYERVITYTSNSKGELYGVLAVSGTSAKETYSSASNTIGSVALGEKTTILDAGEYAGRYTQLNKVSALSDGTVYEAYAYNKLEDGTYEFVLLLDGYVNTEEEQYTQGFGIIENVFQKAGDRDCTAKIILPDLSVVEYTVKNKEAENECLSITFDEGYNIKPVSDRVASYKVNSDNEIFDVQPMSGENKYYAMDTYFSNKIGNIELGSRTKIVDASEYNGRISEYHNISLSALENGAKYTAYAYNKLDDGTYEFVLLLDGFGEYTDDTEIAVFVKNLIITDKENEARNAIEVLYKGEKQTFIVDCIDTFDINKGDVIVFRTNFSDEIDDIRLLAEMNLCNGTREIAPADRDYKVNVNVDAFPSAWLDADSWVGTENVYYGRITDYQIRDYITLANANDDVTPKDEKYFDVDKDTRVYVYSYSSNDKNALYIGTFGDIRKSHILSGAKDGDMINWTYKDMWAYTNYAFVKAWDGVAQQVYIVIMDNE